MMIGPRHTPTERAERQLARTFSDQEDPLVAARAWATSQLADAGIDPATRPMAAVRALRRADGRLGRVAARYLVDAAAGRPSSRGRSFRGPLTR